MEHVTKETMNWMKENNFTSEETVQSEFLFFEINIIHTSTLLFTVDICNRAFLNFFTSINIDNLYLKNIFIRFWILQAGKVYVSIFNYHLEHQTGIFHGIQTWI